MRRSVPGIIVVYFCRGWFQISTVCFGHPLGACRTLSGAHPCPNFCITLLWFVPWPLCPVVTTCHLDDLVSGVVLCSFTFSTHALVARSTACQAHL
jgi:hypothetical protein